MTNSNSSGAGDDFVPAPDAAQGASQGATPAAASTAGTLDNQGMPLPVKVDSGIGQTAMILSVVAFLLVAGILLFVRNAIKRSLIASRATIDSANAASWCWYASLLLFTALVIGGIAAQLFALPLYISLTVAVLVLGIALSMMLTSRARRSV